MHTADKDIIDQRKSKGAGKRYNILFFVTMLVILLIIASREYIMKKFYNYEKARAKREATLSVNAFSDHTVQIINQVNIILHSVRMYYYLNNSEKETNDFIAQLGHNTSIIENIFIVDSNGSFVIPNSEEIKEKNVKHRDYFRFHRDHNEDILFFSSVEKGVVSGKYRFRITRRINNPDGTFGGVVLATVSPESYISYLRELHIGEESVASIYGINDKKLRARFPGIKENKWDNPVVSEVWKILDQTKEGDYNEKSFFDGIKRFYRFKVIEPYPLVMVIGFSDNDIKNRIADKSLILLIFEVIIIFLIVLIALIFHRVIYNNELLQKEIQERWIIEESLKKSESRYRMIVDTAIEGILSLNKDGEITFANDQFLNMIGHPREEAIGQNFELFLPHDQIEEHRKQMKIRSQGQDSVYERCILRKDGKRHWVLISSKAVMDSNGNFAGSFAMFTDINKRKQIELEQDRLIKELQLTIVKVRQLEGILPICTYCKKVRDDKGYWDQVEAYISLHSEAKFSQGICPECMKKFYPEYPEGINENNPDNESLKT